MKTFYDEEAEGLFEEDEFNAYDEVRASVRTVDRLLDRLYDRFGISYSEVESLLQEEEPHTLQRLSALWNEINTDIFAAAESGMLTSFACRRWRQALGDWTETLLDALRRLQERLEAELEPATPRYTAAA